MLPHQPQHLDGVLLLSAGWSAQVVRYLCRALGGTRWKPTLFAGSIGPLTDTSNAHHFFSDIDCEALDYSPARSQWRSGADPMAAAVPMPASYEDKGGRADRIFFDLDDAAFDRQVDSWTRFFIARAAAAPEVVHLHHLTPMHEAVRIVWPDVPVITHLHGTELKMLASVHDDTGRRPVAVRRSGSNGCAVGGRLRPCGRRRRSRRADGAPGCLPVDPCRITMIASGVDTDVFAPRAVTHPANGSSCGSAGSSTNPEAGARAGRRIDSLRRRRSVGVHRRRRPAGAGRAVRRSIHALQAIAAVDRGAPRRCDRPRRAAPCW